MNCNRSPVIRPDLAKYVEFLKGQVRELCTNYGKISCFWWDMNVTKLVDPSINNMIRQTAAERRHQQSRL